MWESASCSQRCSDSRSIYIWKGCDVLERHGIWATLRPKSRSHYVVTKQFDPTSHLTYLSLSLSLSLTHSTAQHSTVQHSTAQHTQNTQHSTAHTAHAHTTFKITYILLSTRHVSTQFTHHEVRADGRHDGIQLQAEEGKWVGEASRRVLERRFPKGVLVDAKTKREQRIQTGELIPLPICSVLRLYVINIDIYMCIFMYIILNVFWF